MVGLIIILPSDRIMFRSEEETIKFYRETEHYIEELSNREKRPSTLKHYKIICSFFKRKRISKALDYGGGVGGLCIYLNQHGIPCDYLDIKGKTFQTAVERFRSLNIQINTIDALAEPKTYYQAVIAYDVLEHIHDISKAIQKISAYLVSGGFFISKSTFAGGGLHLPKNEKYLDTKLFNELCRRYSLKYLGIVKQDYLSQAFIRKFPNLVFSARLKKSLKPGGNFLLHQKILKGDSDLFP